MTAKLKAPFPWFGGKSRVAHLVWQRFGDVPNYIEPFAGSLAVLLGRPASHKGKREIVNDKDRYIVNFWRAVQAEPDAVMRHATNPVNEVDLRARHDWLIRRGRELLEALDVDPFAFDARVAGWWVWGLSTWIGGGWCNADRKSRTMRRPHLGPNVGIIARPRVEHLSRRFEKVKVCCGDWSRTVTDAVMAFRPVGVFLDPPYSNDVRADGCYGEHDDGSVAEQARRWAIEHGDDPGIRIALCGYEEEHADAVPDTWDCVAWKATGGSTRGRGTPGDANRSRERIWFSPACLKAQREMFA